MGRTALNLFSAFLMILIIILLSSQAFGIGVAPAQKKLAWSGPIDETYNYYVINNENKDMNVKISLGGDLQYYLSAPSIVKVYKHEDMKKFSVRLKLDEKPHKNLVGEIIISEQIEEGQIKATGVVISKIFVDVGVYEQNTQILPYENNTQESSSGRQDYANLSVSENETIEAKKSGGPDKDGLAYFLWSRDIEETSIVNLLLFIAIITLSIIGFKAMKKAKLKNRKKEETNNAETKKQ